LPGRDCNSSCPSQAGRPALLPARSRRSSSFWRC